MHEAATCTRTVIWGSDIALWWLIRQTARPTATTVFLGNIFVLSKSAGCFGFCCKPNIRHKNKNVREISTLYTGYVSYTVVLDGCFILKKKKHVIWFGHKGYCLKNCNLGYSYSSVKKILYNIKTCLSNTLRGVECVELKIHVFLIFSTRWKCEVTLTDLQL